MGPLITPRQVQVLRDLDGQGPLKADDLGVRTNFLWRMWGRGLVTTNYAYPRVWTITSWGRKALEKETTSV